MRPFSLLALLLSLPLVVAAPQGGAGEEMRPDTPTSRPVKAVLELFTSQGCSSCPPADALLKTYAGQRDVMALSLPVEIWDHLGWKDTLANPRNSDRQRAYARAFEQGPVYTPQMVINGVAHAVGSNRTEIEHAIENDTNAFAQRRVPVRFIGKESVFVIELGAAPEGRASGTATVWLGKMLRSVSVPIKRGENAGRTVTYSNVVTELVPVGAWDGTPKQLQLTRAAVLHAESEDAFVLVQEGETGPIIGASWLGG